LVWVEQAKQLALKAKVPLKQYRNKKLPNKCLKNGTWSNEVIGSMLMWASSHYNPWSIDDKETAHALRIICSKFYSVNTVAKMSLNDPGCPAVLVVC